MPDRPVPPDDLDRRTERELERAQSLVEQARNLAVALEGENAHLAARCSELETERDEYLEALRGATARVFDERRKILPMRLERDELAARVRGLRQALEASEHARISLEERLGLDDDETERIVTPDGTVVARVRRPGTPDDLIAVAEQRVRRSVIATEPACGVPHPNRAADLRCGRPVGHGGGHADPEVVGALWHEEGADA